MSTTNNHVETFKLLNVSDDTNSPSEDDVLSLPPPRRKIKTRRKPRPSSSPSSGTVGGRWAIRVLAGTTVVVALGLLGWLLFTLQLRVDTLEQRLADVEIGSKNTPEELHSIHARLKGLEDTNTGLRDNLTQTIADLAIISSQVQKLISTVESLHQSIATAPQIEMLPKAVASLQESVATMGSKITALEMDAKETKQIATSTTQSVQENKDKMQQLNQLCNKTDASLDVGWKDVERLKTVVERFNTSLEAEIHRAEIDRQQQKNQVDSLQNVTTALSAQVAELNNFCRSDSNCSVGDGNRNDQLNSLTDLYQQLVLRVDSCSQTTNTTLKSHSENIKALQDQFLNASQRLSSLESSANTKSKAESLPNAASTQDSSTLTLPTASSSIKPITRSRKSPLSFLVPT